MAKRFSERIVLIAVAVLTIIIMSVSIYFERRVSNQKTMYYQLQALRTAVNLYKAVNMRNPDSLRELAIGEFSFPGEAERRRYLEGPIFNRKGVAIDPFGNPYNYDPLNGWVRSTTPGYEYW